MNKETIKLPDFTKREMTILRKIFNKEPTFGPESVKTWREWCCYKGLGKRTIVDKLMPRGLVAQMPDYRTTIIGPHGLIEIPARAYNIIVNNDIIPTTQAVLSAIEGGLLKVGVTRCYGSKTDNLLRELVGLPTATEVGQKSIPWSKPRKGWKFNPITGKPYLLTACKTRS